MRSKEMKASLAIVIAIAVLMVFTVPFLHVDMQAHGATAAEKKAYKAAKKVAKTKKKTGIYKIKGSYYLVKGKKIKTGFQKFKKKTYYFNSYGVMQQGKTTIDGHLYVMGNTGKLRKARKKTPVWTGVTREVSGKKMYFSAKGRGFYSVGSSKGNKAVAIFMDSIRFKNSDTPKQKMKKAYKQIQKKYKYLNWADVKPSGSSWIGEAAYKIVDTGKGYCYNYGAITGLVAKSLGLDASIIAGEFKVTGSNGYGGEHCWVEVKDNGQNDYTVVLDSIFDDNSQYGGKVTYHFFWIEPVDDGDVECDYELFVGDSTYRYKKNNYWK